MCRLFFETQENRPLHFHLTLQAHHQPEFAVLIGESAGFAHQAVVVNHLLLPPDYKSVRKNGLCFLQLDQPKSKQPILYGLWSIFP